MIPLEIQRKKFLETAIRFLDKPYIWGGDDPIKGFDCSGLVVECLQTCGRIEHKEDYSADGLYKKYRYNTVISIIPGCLIFWIDDTFGIDKAIHVEIFENQYYLIGASGGGSKTETIEEAIKKNAYVKSRPRNYRKGDTRIIDPFQK
jgi:cell wall-associated NlpC family hydrolase